MEKIELRSEKVRNFIGIIPPFLIRLGNIFIFFLLIIILIIGYMVKLPNTVSCEVRACEQGNSVQLAVVSVSKLITTPIKRGSPVKIYRDGVLLYNGALNEELDKISISPDKLQVFIPIFFAETIITKEQMNLFLGNNTHLICEIEIDNQSIIKNIFGNLLK